MAKREVRLKLLIDSKSQRVLFGEADKNFIDFLFNLISLPLGTVIRLLKNETMVGSLGNVYDSIENLNDTYLQPNQRKDTLLKPTFCCGSLPMLLPDDTYSSTSAIYVCKPNTSRGCNDYYADNPNAICPICKKSMTKTPKLVQPASAKSTSGTAGEEKGGIVKGVVSYMVMDDLSVKPMSAVSSITLLNKFNIKDVGALEEKLVTLDVNEGVKLLKASLQSNTVLTDVFIGTMTTTTPKSNSKGKKTTPTRCSKTRTKLSASFCLVLFLFFSIW